MARHQLGLVANGSMPGATCPHDPTTLGHTGASLNRHVEAEPFRGDEVHGWSGGGGEMAGGAVAAGKSDSIDHERVPSWRGRAAGAKDPFTILCLL